jgi:hypothetical protein
MHVMIEASTGKELARTVLRAGARVARAVLTASPYAPRQHANLFLAAAGIEQVRSADCRMRTPQAGRLRSRSQSASGSR